MMVYFHFSASRWCLTQVNTGRSVFHYNQWIPHGLGYVFQSFKPCRVAHGNVFISSGWISSTGIAEIVSYPRDVFMFNLQSVNNGAYFAVNTVSKA